MEKSILNQEVKDELAQVDDRIADLQNQVELKEALERLHENEDFKKVVLEADFEKEADRVFGMLVEPSSLKRDSMENMMDKLTTIRNFKQFFSTTLINGHMAPEQIEGEQDFRKELTARNSIEG